MIGTNDCGRNCKECDGSCHPISDSEKSTPKKMKTVTREEVERVLDKYLVAFDEPKKILNELFPPEFKVGDWVIGWHAGNKYRNKAWQIGGFKKDNGSVIPKEKPNWATGLEDIRHATPEEIAEAIKLEDDSVYMAKHSTLGLVTGYNFSVKKIGAHDGYKFRLSDDCKEVSLVKDEKC